jgi:hypothetical protein
MKIKTNVKAGRIPGGGPTISNHNQTVTRGLTMKSDVRAGNGPGGSTGSNHNQNVARGLKVQSHLRAGVDPPNPDRSEKK